MESAHEIRKHQCDACRSCTRILHGEYARGGAIRDVFVGLALCGALYGVSVLLQCEIICVRIMCCESSSDIALQDSTASCDQQF
jgi:hypothetical protein